MGGGLRMLQHRIFGRMSVAYSENCISLTCDVWSTGLGSSTKIFADIGFHADDEVQEWIRLISIRTPFYKTEIDNLISQWDNCLKFIFTIYLKYKTWVKRWYYIYHWSDWTLEDVRTYQVYQKYHLNVCPDFFRFR